jgi:colicin import membrane protein
MPTTFAKPTSYGPSSAADPAEGRSFGGAFWVSALLHGGAAALLVLLTLAVHDRAKEEPKVFELVDGEGKDFMATEAPAGSEAGQAETGETLFTAPGEVPSWTPPAPEPEPEPVAPAAPPEPPTTPVSKVEPVPFEPVKPVVETPPVPNFKSQINRKLKQEKAKTDKELKKQREADARAAKERELASKRLSPSTNYSDFQKSQGNKTSPSQKAGAGTGAPGPRVDPSGIKQGVTGGTGAGSKGAGGTALSASEGERMDRYFAMLINRLRENHEKPDGLSDLLNAEVRFTVAANGVISGVQIARSSGNADFDQSVVEAFARVKMPARPDGKTDVQQVVFRIKEA